jgi:hypothetical protein
MTNTTPHPEFNPGRSPLFAVAAVFATAATIGIAVLLPGQHVSTVRDVAAVTAVPPATIAIQPAIAVANQAETSTQLVTLPAVHVVGTRPTKSAVNRWNVPAVFKQKG